MRGEVTLDDIRRRVLDRADREERAWTGWLVAAAVVEGGCLLAFALLADFHDRLHLLLLIVAVLVYGTLALGILALGTYTRNWCRRILTAVERSAEESQSMGGETSPERNNG